MRRIAIADQVDLVRAVLIQIRGENGREPDSRHDTRAQVAFPVDLTRFVKHSQIQRALGKEKHPDVGIDLRIRRVQGCDCLGSARPQFDRHGAQLTDRLPEIDFRQHGQINWYGTCDPLCKSTQQYNRAYDPYRRDHGCQVGLRTRGVGRL